MEHDAFLALSAHVPLLEDDVWLSRASAGPRGGLRACSDEGRKAHALAVGGLRVLQLPTGIWTLLGFQIKGLR